MAPREPGGEPRQRSGHHGALVAIERAGLFDGRHPVFSLTIKPGRQLAAERGDVLQRDLIEKAVLQRRMSAISSTRRIGQYCGWARMLRMRRPRAILFLTWASATPPKRVNISSSRNCA